MLLPYLAWAPPARAQAAPIDVFVLDFNNKTNLGGALLGKVGAAQVSLQLSESVTWSVIPDAQVQRRIQELNLRPPYDRVNRVQIADGVDAQGIVYGNITQARVTGGNTPQAYVRLEVVVEDRKTGVLMNGAMVEGLSTPRMGYTGDADILLEEAMGKAAFKAREFMDRFRLPEGTVLNTTVVGSLENPQLDALVNFGSRQGVRRGMEIIVTRQRELVGRAKVVQVDSDISTARVIENIQGVKPEDRVRAVFNFADFPQTRSRLKAISPEGLPKVGSALPGLPGPEGDRENPKVVQAGKGGVFVPFRARDEGLLAQTTVPVPPPVVVDEPELQKPGEKAQGGPFGRKVHQMLVGGLLLVGILAIGGRGGAAATRAHGTEAFAYQLQVGDPGARIKFCWERPKSIRSSQVLQYVIWRTDTNTGVREIVGALDNDAIHCFIDTEATRTVNAFDGDPGSDDAGSRTAVQNVPGIVPGIHYRYEVATAYLAGYEDRDGDGIPDTGPGAGGGGGGGQTDEYMSPLSLPSHFVTALTPPSVVAPVQGQQVDLGELTVTWQQTPGANTYYVWVSKHPSFRSNQRVAFGPFTTLPVDQGGDLTVTQVLDVRSNRLLGQAVVYVSVGGRNSNDRSNPQPFGAVFSAPVSVRPEVTPPPPPGSGSPGRPGRGTGRPATGRPVRG